MSTLKLTLCTYLFTTENISSEFKVIIGVHQQILQVLEEILAVLYVSLCSQHKTKSNIVSKLLSKIKNKPTLELEEGKKMS